MNAGSLGALQQRCVYRPCRVQAKKCPLEAGKWADLVVLDPAATPVLRARQEISQSLEDVLFSLMILGDDRAVRATYVKGKKVYDRLSA